jgi:hypothetical protein
VWFHWMALTIVVVANVSCNDAYQCCRYRVHGIRPV